MRFMSIDARNRLTGEWSLDWQIETEQHILRGIGYPRDLASNAETYGFVCSEYLTADFSLTDLLTLADAIVQFPGAVVRKVIQEIRPRGVFTVPYLVGALRKDGGAAIEAARREARIQAAIAQSEPVSHGTVRDADLTAQLWEQAETERRIEDVCKNNSAT